MTLQTRCADSLRELAADPIYHNRAEDLEGLANAVADEDDDSWTGIDLIGAFPPHATVSVGHKVAVERVLGVLAGVSVFLPVGWTWWSLQRASSAYSEVLSDHDEAGRTFLALWTTGFDGRLDYVHRLVPMALVAVVLIVLAMGFIVTHRVVSQRNVTQEEGRTAAAESALFAALTMAMRCLNERRADDSDHIATMVRRSVRALRDAHEDLKRSTESLTNLTERVSGTLEPMLENANELSRELKAAALAAQSASNELGKNVGDLGKDVAGALSDLESGLDRQTTELRDATTHTLKELSDTTRSAATTLTSETKAALSAVEAEMEKLHEAVGQLSSTNSTAASDLHGTISQLSELIGRLDDALLRHESALQGQASELTGARDAAERMLHQLENRLNASNDDGSVSVHA